MVNATKAMESKYVNVDLIRESPSKKAIILGEGEYVEGDYGEKLELPIEIDGKQKTWSPNKDSVKNMNSEWGVETRNWISGIVKYSIIKTNGKDVVLGLPSGRREETVN